MCITVSTRYSDILRIILPQNQKHFSKWIIVTHPDDAETISVIKELGDPAIVSIMFFDFYTEERKFNKGGAIRLAQETIPEYSGPILLLDSDIYLPDTLSLPTIKHDTLYAPSQRLDYHTYERFKSNKPDKKYKNKFYGFFQLYWKSDNKYLYDDSKDASECDTIFADLFKKRAIVPLLCKHLGQDIINWCGRVGELNYACVSHTK